jgi:hypothetical protein
MAIVTVAIVTVAMAGSRVIMMVSAMMMVLARQQKGACKIDG